MSVWRGGAWRVSGVLRVVLRRRGGSAGSWRAVLGRRAGWRGVACRVGAAWWWVGSGGLACRVGVARWVGGGGMEVARLHEKPAMSSVLRAMLGRRSGLVVAGCWGRMEVVRVREWPATSVQGFACRVGAARQVGSGGVLGQGRMKAAHVHEWPAMSKVLRAVLGRRGGLAVAACWRWRRVASHVGAGESGEAGRGVEVGAQAGVRPLPSPCAREPPEPPPLIPTPTRRPDMARNTTATQDGEHGRGRAGLRPKCIRYAIAVASSMQVIYNRPAPARRPNMTRDTPPPPPQHGSQYHGYARWRTWPRTSWASAQMHKISRCPDMTRDTMPPPPQHGTQHPDHQPATTPPQYGTQHPATANLPCCLNTTRNTPPTRHATSTRHARPSRHRPPRHPDTARNTPPPATDPHATLTRRATPRHPPPTPTPPRHGAQHPATCRLTATPTQHTPRLRHVAQDPADPPRHLNMARKAATTNPMTRN
ncbi:hypothetical protein EDB86DRAFT_2835335 [Lactarius hatsudake]|nr:hypothetical protein EDB86DRAFT_2835335 [Lactarius hatsudake]